MKRISEIIRRPLVWICIAVVYALPLFTLNGAVDMFLKLDGIPGESTDKTHANEIDVLAWSWGMSRTGTQGRFSSRYGTTRMSVGSRWTPSGRKSASLQTMPRRFSPPSSACRSVPMSPEHGSSTPHPCFPPRCSRSIPSHGCQVSPVLPFSVSPTSAVSVSPLSRSAVILEK